jgi:DNA-directed RNA polymerase subunit RPC12/RpoP
MRHNIRLVIAFSIATLAVAWIALMVSYWLPDPAGRALMATACALGFPALIAGGICFIGETEIVNELEKRSEKTARTRPMRCTDCGSKILNAAGTTIGDQIEDEVMMLEPPTPIRDPKGNWHPPDDGPFDRRGR